MKTSNHDWQRDRPIEDAAFTSGSQIDVFIIRAFTTDPFRNQQSLVPSRILNKA